MYVVSHSKPFSYSIIVHYVNMFIFTYYSIACFFPNHMFIMKKVKKVELQFASKTLLQIIKSKIWGSERIYLQFSIETSWMSLKFNFSFKVFLEAKYILLGNWIAGRWSTENFYFWDFHFILNISSISNNYGLQGNKEFFVFHFSYNFLFFAKKWVTKKN